MQEEQDVAIIGAGPVGGALACRLARLGRRVVLVDRAALPPMEHPDFDGRAYAIAAGSKRLLDEAGLWEELPYPAPARSSTSASPTVSRAIAPRPCVCISTTGRLVPNPSAGSSRPGPCASPINRRLHDDPQHPAAGSGGGPDQPHRGGRPDRDPRPAPACRPGWWWRRTGGDSRLRAEAGIPGDAPCPTSNPRSSAPLPTKSRTRAWRSSTSCQAGRSRSCR